MFCSPSRILARFLLIVLTLLAATAFAAEGAGTVQFTIGDVNIIGANGVSRAAEKGATVAAGETIVTGASSNIHLKMFDGGIIAMRPESRVKIDQYVFEGKTDGRERALFSLISGSFRAITGLIGSVNKENYRINTPTGYIGIRGTDHEPTYIPPPPPGAAAPLAPPGTYCKVNTGIAFIQTPQGIVNIAANQVGYASGNQAPVLLPKVPEFFRSTPSPRAPASGAKTAAASNSSNQSTQSGQSGQSAQSNSGQSSGNGTTSGGGGAANTAASTAAATDSQTAAAPAPSTSTAEGTASNQTGAASTATPTAATTAGASTASASSDGAALNQTGTASSATQTAAAPAGGSTTSATSEGTVSNSTGTAPGVTQTAGAPAGGVATPATTEATASPPMTAAAATTSPVPGGTVTGTSTSIATSATAMQTSVNTSLATSAVAASPLTTTTAGTNTVTQTITATSTAGSAQSLSLTAPTTLTTNVAAATASAVIPGAQVLTGYQYAMSSAGTPPIYDFRIDAFNAAISSLISKDGNGNLLAVSSYKLFNDNTESLAISGGTAVPTLPSAGPNGTALGWIAPGTSGMTVYGSDFAGCFGATSCAIPARSLGPAGLAWVTGPLASPFYLSSVTLGAAGTNIGGYTSYALGASTTPRDASGAAGVVNSASLGIDFTRQSVNFSMQATNAAGGVWNAQAQAIKLDSDGFSAYTGGSSGTHDQLSVSYVYNNSNATSVYGGIKGALMGSGLNAAGLTYFFSDSTSNVPNTLNGALAFSGPTQSTTDNFRLGAMAIGMLPTTAYLDEQNQYLAGGFTAAARTQFVNNAPVTFDGNFNVISNSCPLCTPQSVPAVYAAGGATGLSSIGTAQLAESGYDSTTGISWGRYAGGTLGVNDRISGTALGTINLANQSMHYILSGLQSAPTALPVSGSFIYTLVGRTSPTDNLGNVGTLDSASLTANFSTQTVSVALGATVAGNSWSAAATDIPIKYGTFEATKSTSASTLSVSSSLGGTTGGKLVGAFGGSNGSGAALLYSLNQGGNITGNSAAVTVSGVAVFRR